MSQPKINAVLSYRSVGSLVDNIETDLTNMAEQIVNKFEDGNKLAIKFFMAEDYSEIQRENTNFNIKRWRKLSRYQFPSDAKTYVVLYNSVMGSWVLLGNTRQSESFTTWLKQNRDNEFDYVLTIECNDVALPLEYLDELLNKVRTKAQKDSNSRVQKENQRIRAEIAAEREKAIQEKRAEIEAIKNKNVEKASELAKDGESHIRKL